MNSITMERKLRIMMVATAMLMAVGFTEVFSQTASVYRIQSLFLYNFSKHVKWENTEGATFTIGVYGNKQAFEQIREGLKNKRTWGNFIKVIEITSPADVSQCHILYLPKSNKKKVVEFIRASGNVSNTLIVTEDDLVKEGAAISFIFQQSKMNFKISKDRIEQCGLKVSSSLVSIGVAA